MSHELAKTLVWAALAVAIAFVLVKQFVVPWLDAKDRSPLGRAGAVADSLDQALRDRGTVFGSRARTVWVSVVNIVAMGGLALLSAHLWPPAAFYPLIGLGMLKLFGVPKDRRLNPWANRKERFDMRLYQAWAWPALIVWKFLR